MLFQDKVIVLMYHDICEKESRFNISPERFISHIDGMLDSGYNFISMEDYLQAFKQKNGLPPNSILLTFDDGYLSFYHFVFPELKKRSIVATNFIVSHVIDHSPNLPKLDYDQIHDIPHLTWSQMREMKKYGFSFYNHTHNHHHQGIINQFGDYGPKLSNRLYLMDKKRVETVTEYKDRISNDLFIAEKRLVQELGNEERILCFPYGEYNKTVLEVGKLMNFKLFFTVKEGINNLKNIKVNRIDAGSPLLDKEGLLKSIKQYYN